MIRFTYKRGLAFLDGQTRWTLDRLLASGKYQFLSDLGDVRNLFPHEVHSKWLSGEWTVDEASLGQLNSAIYLATPRDLRTYTDHQQRVALRRYGYLEAVKPEQNRYSVKSWKALINEHARGVGDDKPPCPATVHNWWRKYRTTKTVNELVPRNKGRSNPYNTDRYAIFEEAVAEVYLTLQKKPKAAVYDRVQEHVRAVNAARTSDQHIECPTRSTVYRWLAELRQDIVDSSRLGAEAARAKYRVAMGGMHVDGLLERVEIDHTPIDLIVTDEVSGLPLGRPWLTLAESAASRMPMGFYLSFNTPSAYSVLQCLRRSILPKTEWLAKYPEIKGVWPAQGIPSLIAVDNGMDLHSTALSSTCMELGIQLLYCGARTPQHKGKIERFFRTLNKGLIHRLPGTTFSNPVERGDYPSEKLAAITLDDLMFLITKWIVDVYLVTPHRALGVSPLAKWSELASRQEIPLPAYPQQLEVITGIPAKRTLFHYGIELEGLHYNSRQLQELRRRSGMNMPVDLKLYEDDTGYIHVFDPQGKEYIKVPAVLTQYAADLPRTIHRLVQEHIRTQCGENFSPEMYLEARAVVEQRIQQSIRKKKMAFRKAAEGARMHDSESVLNEDDMRIAESRPRGPRFPVPEELPPGLDDELPPLVTFAPGNSHEQR